MKKLLSTTLIVILFLSVFSMVSFATESTMHLISYDFDSGSGGWYVFKSTQALERAPRWDDNTNYCITACNEGKSYVSPALNIYDDLKSGGAGTYVINMEARYSFYGVPLIEARMVLRSEDSHSMLTSIDSEGNYYKAIGIRTDIPDSNWTNLSGSFKITEADLEEDTGEIILCLDYLFENFPEGEISIDNVTICKLDEYNITNGDFSLGTVGWRNWSNYGNFTIGHNSILGFNYADYVKASTYGSIATNIDQIIAKNGCTKYEISFGIYFNEESYENLDEIVFFLTKNSSDYHFRLGQQTKDNIEAERWYTFTYTVDMAMTTAIGNLYDRLTPHTDEVFFRLEYRSAEDADSDGEQSYYIKDVSFTVAPDVSNIVFPYTFKEVYENWEGQLIPIVNGNQFAREELIWYSSDESVITVDNNGNVKAVGVGSAYVTATPSGNNKIYAMCIFAVGEYKQAVILLHGRSDNSVNVFGAANGISKDLSDDLDNNDHYSSSKDALSKNNKLYTSLDSQKIQSFESNGITVNPIFNGKYDSTGHHNYDGEERDGNLAYYLVNEKGYEPNVNLFVFNYPNEDAVVHNAIKFRIFIDNLMQYARTQGSVKMRMSFYPESTSDINSYSFSIVGHSMGGLVARYYIENCTNLEHYINHSHGDETDCQYHDANVSKLITIDTPHWGSGWANASCMVDIANNDSHYLCDHDLAFSSAMYGGNLSQIQFCNAYGNTTPYIFTDELKYNRPRQTVYYAIAGINYFCLPSRNNKIEEISPDLFLYGQLTLEICNKFGILTIPIDSGDDIVGLCSQIGWTETGDIKVAPGKRISFHKIAINIDSNGGNGVLSSNNHFHGKMPHRIDVIEKISEYLGE